MSKLQSQSLPRLVEIDVSPRSAHAMQFRGSEPILADLVSPFRANAGGSLGCPSAHGQRTPGTPGTPGSCTRTSRTAENLEQTGCPRLIKFPVLLSLLAILNQHRRVQFLHPSSLHRLRRCRPRHRRRPVLCLRSSRCQRPPRSEPNGTRLEAQYFTPSRRHCGCAAIRSYPSAPSASSITSFSPSENDNVRACSRPSGDIFFHVFRNISIILPRSVLAMRSAS
jgi:hypothetical protein